MTTAFLQMEIFTMQKIFKTIKRKTKKKNILGLEIVVRVKKKGTNRKCVFGFTTGMKPSN